MAHGRYLRRFSHCCASLARRRHRYGLALAAGIALLFTTGCAVHRVRVDYTGFEKAFADTSNHELLLNLARLQNHDPTYFFKLGQINSSYRMAATLTSTASYALQGTVPGGAAATGGGSPGLSYENDPTFQFIPVNDETNAQLLLKPIPPDTFYILYQQGWRMDQLMRLMVDRIEVTSSAAKGCNVTTYRNVPPAYTHDGKLLDPDQASAYTTFLRIAAIAYGLQKHGDLLLRGVSVFTPLNANAVPIASQPITADSMEKAAEKNLSYETSNGKVMIGQRNVNPRFYLIPPKGTTPYEPDLQAVGNVIRSDASLAGLDRGVVLEGFLAALHDGLTIEGDADTAQMGGDPCPVGPQRSSAHLVLRSLIGVMAAAAQEQAPFDRMNTPELVLKSQPGDTALLNFQQAVPEIERNPIIRLDWKHSTVGNPTAPLTQLAYRGMTYMIADSKEPSVPENEFWNRDVFRLINALTAQVTVDVSKYPVPDVLQLHTN